MSHPKYRPDIDGLRAIAVLSVLGYHAFPEFIKGGFIGVDIFFVISGFLISSIILESLIKEEFSLIEFYIKRIKRIFPALALVLLACLAYGWFALFAAEYQLLGKHIAAGSAFISNIVFWRESSYFDTASELKPLLHLWSLGIEEQFYIFWPLLLWLPFLIRHKRTVLAGVLLVVLSLSFILNLSMVESKPTATFYLPVTRFWELLIGALLAYLTVFHGGIASALAKLWGRQNDLKLHFHLSSLMSWSGVALLMLALVLINSNTPFPGWAALLPTVGIFLIISAGIHPWFNHKILASRILVSIGLISYPLYLWHWPLLSFTRIEFGEISLGGRVLIVITTLVLAWLTYRYVERPLRANKAPYIPAVLLLVVFLAGGFGWLAYKGIVHRNANDERSVYVNHFENSAPQYRYFKNHNVYSTYRLSCDFYDLSTNQTRQQIDKSCYTPVKNKKSLFIWGDSHAQQFNYGLSKTLPADIVLLQVATSACNPSIEELKVDTLGSCNKSNKFALHIIEQSKPEIVLLAQSAGHERVDWDAIAVKLKVLGVKKVILVGPVPHWKPDLYKLLARTNSTHRPDRLSRGLDELSINTDRLLKDKFQSSTTLHYVSVLDKLCNEKGCITYLGNDPVEGIMSFDYGHLTAPASLYVAEKLLAPLINRLENEQ